MSVVKEMYEDFKLGHFIIFGGKEDFEDTKV